MNAGLSGRLAVFTLIFPHRIIGFQTIFFWFVAIWLEPLLVPSVVRRFSIPGFALIAALAMAACAQTRNPAFEALAREPLPSSPWSFTEHPGSVVETAHYRIYTTIDDPLYEHLIARVLEAAHTRALALIPPSARPHTEPLDCYVFANRSQWEHYTRDRAGSNAPIYLQISSGGYCQEGVFAGYDIGRDQTLSVIAHESWHQYSWFAFKDRLPAWLEEGLATQNEAIIWNSGDPEFHPELNARRFAALRQAVRDHSLFKLPDLLATHAGRVIKLPQASIDAYYAQLWSLVLFLEQSPDYAPRLRNLLADAATGKLTKALAGTTVTQREIDDFTEHWNAVAGSVYMERYINPDLGVLEAQYTGWVEKFVQGPPNP